MRLNAIPNDLGGRLNGATFKRVFREYVAEYLPGQNPKRVWRTIWKDWDREFPDDPPRELAVKIIDSVLDLMQEMTSKRG